MTTENDKAPSYIREISYDKAPSYTRSLCTHALARRRRGRGDLRRRGAGYDAFKVFGTTLPEKLGAKNLRESGFNL